MGESAYVSGSERRILRKSMIFAIEVELNQQYDMSVLEMATERGVPLFLQTILKLQVGHHGKTARRHDGTCTTVTTTNVKLTSRAATSPSSPRTTASRSSVSST